MEQKNNESGGYPPVRNLTVQGYLFFDRYMRKSFGLLIIVIIVYYLITNGKEIDLNYLRIMNPSAFAVLFTILISISVLFLFFILCLLLRYTLFNVSANYVVYTLLMKLIYERSKHGSLPKDEYKKEKNLLGDIYVELERMKEELDNLSDKGPIRLMRTELDKFQNLFYPKGAIYNLIFLCSINSFLSIKGDLISSSKIIKEGTYSDLISVPETLERKIMEMPEYKEKVKLGYQRSKLKELLLQIYEKLRPYLGNKEKVIGFSELLEAYEKVIIALFSISLLVMTIPYFINNQGEISTFNFWINIIPQIFAPLMFYSFYMVIKFILGTLARFSKREVEG